MGAAGTGMAAVWGGLAAAWLLRCSGTGLRGYPGLEYLAYVPAGAVIILAVMLDVLAELCRSGLRLIGRAAGGWGAVISKYCHHHHDNYYIIINIISSGNIGRLAEYN